MCWPHVNPVPSGAVGKDCQRRLLSRPRFVRACSATDFIFMGPTALLPLPRKSCDWFLSPLKMRRPRPGWTPRTLGPVVSTLTTMPSRVRSALSVLVILHCYQYVHYTKIALFFFIVRGLHVTDRLPDWLAALSLRPVAVGVKLAWAPPLFLRRSYVSCTL
jgi:hypothetical protein